MPVAAIIRHVVSVFHRATTMKKFHPIRTAVKIGLIVTMMMIQPMLFVAAASLERSSNSTTNATSAACEGCGCCEVASANEQCCCCSVEDGDASGMETEQQVTGSLHAACHCGLTIPPFGAGNKGAGRFVTRHVESSNTDSVADADAKQGAKWLWLGTSREAIPLRHHSQLFLCVWLI